MPDFNPDEHLLRTKRKKWNPETRKKEDIEEVYLEVKWRIYWFREKYPHGSIETIELCVDLDKEFEKDVEEWDNGQQKYVKTGTKKAKGYARYKAIVKDGMGGVSEGTKSECAVDFADYAEKAETGAIGRALAGLGFGTQFAPELNEEHRIVDAPVTRQVSDADLKALAKKAQEIGINTKAGLQTFVNEACGRKDAYESLTPTDLQKVYETIQKRKTEKVAVP